MANKPIRLLFLVDSLSSGGTQQALLDLVSQLPKSDFEISIVSLTSSRDLYSERLRKFSKVYFCHNKPNSILICLNPFFWHQLLKILKNARPDVLHARLNGSLFFGSVLARLQKIPHFIFTIEGSINQHSKLIPFFYKIFLKNADFIFTHYTKEYLKMGLPEHKLRKYKVGILKSEPLAPCRDLPVKNSFPVLLSVGRLHKEKGHQFAIETVKRLKTDFPEILLMICGDGGYRKELEAKARELDVLDSVYFAGFVQEIDWFYANSHFYLNFALNEPPNLANLKAPLYGLPTVAFNNTLETHLRIENHRNGYLVAPEAIEEASKILREVLKDKTRYEMLRESTQKSFSSEFLYNTLAEEYANFYKKLVERPN